MNAGSSLPAAPIQCNGFSPSIWCLQEYQAAALSCLKTPVLHCTDRHLFMGDGELSLHSKCKEIRMATASLKTRSVALSYTNLRLPTCAMLRKIGKHPGDRGSSLSSAAHSICSSRGILNPRMVKPSVQLKVCNKWVPFPLEAGSLPSALMMC